jgi:hypothetical protein
MPKPPSGPVEASTSLRAAQGKFLRDVPADGEAQQVDATEVQRVEEGEGPGRHRGDRTRGVAGRAAHARVVEQDDLALGCDRVDQRRIPVVEVPAEMLKEHQGRGAGRPVAEPAVGEGRPFGLHREVRGGELPQR